MPEWMVTDREDLPEYTDYGDNADRLRNIGQVFPVIFFLVAALIQSYHYDSYGGGAANPDRYLEGIGI